MTALRSSSAAVAAALCALAVACGVLPTAARRPTGAAPAGFAPARAVEHVALEQRALDLVRPARIERSLEALVRRPRLAGSPGGRAAAAFCALELQAAGWEVEQVPYAVLLPYPVVAEVTRVDPPLDGTLPSPEPTAPDAPVPDDVVPPFHGYAADGDVTAEIVYVNRGLPEDYERLAALGVAVEDRIVLARYGGSYRGVKVREAEQRGALACLLYSDPADDGFVRGTVYPDGPWRPAGAVQRGSVGYMFLAPGDPQTPGWASIGGSPRRPLPEVDVLPSIPSLPLSWRDAQALLAPMGGRDAPDDWRGGVPDVPWKLGDDGAVRARVHVASDWQVRPIVNVIARLPGAGSPDEQVVLGAHRDAWVYGACDDGSGVAALLEVARALGEMARDGLRAERTITIGLWDAEEYGLIGSTEWVEQHLDEISASTIAYVNLDVAVSGVRPSVACSASLRGLARDVLGVVPHPSGGRVLDAWHAHRGADAVPEALGSGSDYTAFLQHAGVPSLDLGLVGDYGVYHALQDDMTYLRGVDPGFELHATAARLAAVAALRLANADVPPLDHGETGRAVRERVEALEREHGNAFPPASVQELREAGTRLQEAHWRASALVGQLLAGELALPPDVDAQALIDEIATAWALVERSYLADPGLVTRPWFRHLLVSTSMTDGYATLPLPGLSEALEGKGGDVATETMRLRRALATARVRVLAAVRPLELALGLPVTDLADRLVEVQGDQPLGGRILREPGRRP